MLIGLIAAAAALLGALGTQWLRARADMRMRKLDLVFARKADAYFALCSAIGEFALNPTEKEKYIGFLASVEQATLLASDEAKAEIDNLCRAAQDLRNTSPEQRADPGTFRGWGPQAKKTTAAMRADLGSLCPE